MKMAPFSGKAIILTGNNHSTNPASTPPVVVVSQQPPQGMKANLSQLPGALVAHRLFKNLSYWGNSKKGTVGGIKRAQMTAAEGSDYTKSIFQKIDRIVVARGGWKGKSVLEIGPGDSLGTGLWCLGAGAESYLAIDRFSVDLDQVFEQQVFEVIDSRMTSLEKESCSQFEGIVEGAVHLEKGLHYKNDLPIEMAPEVLGHSRYDVIFSNAVLEHVGDLEGTLRAMWDLLADGGIMFHDVDLRSHQTFENHPLHFLEYPGWLWKLMSSHNGEPNRIRMSGYLDCLTDLGFEEIEAEASQVFDRELVEKMKNRLAAEFKSSTTEELLPAVFWFSCRKPG